MDTRPGTDQDLGHHGEPSPCPKSFHVELHSHLAHCADYGANANQAKITPSAGMVEHCHGYGIAASALLSLTNQTTLNQPPAFQSFAQQIKLRIGATFVPGAWLNMHSHLIAGFEQSCIGAQRQAASDAIIRGAVEGEDLELVCSILWNGRV